MSLLDNIVKKTVKQKKHLKYPALLLSGVAEWVAGTYEEAKANKRTLRDKENESVGKRDYALYQAGTDLGMLTECGTLCTAYYSRNLPLMYGVGADCLIRLVNNIIYLQKKDDQEPGSKHDPQDFTGLIGTARTIAYKLAGKLKRDGGDVEVKLEEDEDPFGDADFQMSSAKPVADAEDDDDGPDFGMGDEGDSGNELF